jgi:uncharacterized protein
VTVPDDEVIEVAAANPDVFGSDFPLVTPDRRLADFAALPIKVAVRPLVLKDNAARLLGLAAA